MTLLDHIKQVDQVVVTLQNDNLIYIKRFINLQHISDEVPLCNFSKTIAEDTSILLHTHIA